MRRHWTQILLSCAFAACLGLAAVSAQGPRRISEDRDLKEIDLTAWDCLKKAEGTARTPDGQERNRLKNRVPTDIEKLKLPDLDIAGYLKSVSNFDAATVHTRRKDLGAGERAQLD